MKILFVYSTINSICTTKCCYDLAVALEEYCETKIINYKSLTKELVENFEIIILQRLGEGALVSEEEKARIYYIIETNKKSKFIYLVDDLILECQSGLPRRLAEICDAVICSSLPLCRKFKRYNINTIKFSTFINTILYDSQKKNIYDKFTIAWVSTAGVGIDLVNKIVSEIKVRNLDVNIIAIGTQSCKLQKSDNVKLYNNMTEIEMIKIIKGSDILLNPIIANNRISNIIKSVYKADANDFLNCKAEIKYLTAGMCHSCLITSNIECYEKVIVNGVNGFILSNNYEEWINIINMLYNNKEYLLRIKENSYKDIKENYDINIVAKEIYNTILQIKNKN